MCDIIARELGTPEEFLVSEEGRNWTGRNGSLKMLKEMRDMLKQKTNKHCVSFVKTNQLENPQYLQILVMTIPSGYMCRLIRYPFNKIPTDFVNIDDLIKICSLIRNDELVFKNGHIRERTEIADESIGNSKIVSENDSREDQAPEIIELSSDEDERTPEIIMILVIFIEQTPETARKNGQQIKFVC
ncbi:hypothetical protein F8M41_006542 [Gigaspora margarita]|uniref:Uncharacterized protein n=1 Tax=Gigaspora margarita TaxID=4874 RepID=A0A8H3X769_GIGMA|nr:hypothetical protein F8M41_006542 [Gigaspora margarita]